MMARVFRIIEQLRRYLIVAIALLAALSPRLSQRMRSVGTQ